MYFLHPDSLEIFGRLHATSDFCGHFCDYYYSKAMSLQVPIGISVKSSHITCLVSAVVTYGFFSKIITR